MGWLRNTPSNFLSYSAGFGMNLSAVEVGTGGLCYLVLDWTDPLFSVLSSTIIKCKLVDLIKALGRLVCIGIYEPIIFPDGISGKL